MSRITRGAAVFAAVAALGAASAAPVSAQDIDPDSDRAICGGQISVPCVVDMTFNVVDHVVHTAEATVQNTLDQTDPIVYAVCEIITDEDCGP